MGRSSSPPIQPSAGATTRRDPRGERAQAAALDAAVDLFLQGGIRAVTIDAVAARSGVAKTTIYRRWANRDDLLVDVFGRFSLGLELPPPDVPARERVSRVVRQFAAALATPEVQRALPAMLGAVLHRGELAALHGRIEAHRERVVSTVLADAVAAGALPAETDPGEAMLQLVGPLFLAALSRPEALSEAFADRLVAGVFGAASERNEAGSGTADDAAGRP